MNFLHWKLLFAIIGAMSLLARALLIFNMPETVTSQGWGFRPGEVFSEFVRAFKQPVVLTGALALSFSNLPIITRVALSPVILIDDGGCRAAPMPGPGACLWRRYYCQHHRGPFYQGSHLSSLYLAHYPDTADRVVGITGGKYCMAPYRWWSVSGTSLYALGTGLLFPVLFRFALFPTPCRKGRFQPPSTLWRSVLWRPRWK